MIDLSIIIPVYKVEGYIEKCLQSIYNQNNNTIKFEVICVNDGSPDQSVLVIENFIQNNNIQNLLLLSQENRGASSARNLGIDNANGKYIWFIDSDDYIRDDSFSIIEEHWNSDHSDYLLKFNYNIVNNGTITQSKIFNSNENFILYNDYDFIFSHRPSYCWNVIYKKSIIDQYQLRFLNGIKNIEDVEFNTRYFYYFNKVKQINAHLYNYVDNDQSTSRTVNDLHLLKLAKDSFIVHNSLKKFVDKVDIHNKKIVLQVLDHSVMGFFYSLYYRPYKIETIKYYYNEYKVNNLLPLKNIEHLSIKMKFFIFLLNNGLFIHLIKRIKKNK